MLNTKEISLLLLFYSTMDRSPVTELTSCGKNGAIIESAPYDKTVRRHNEDNITTLRRDHEKLCVVASSSGDNAESSSWSLTLFSAFSI